MPAASTARLSVQVLEFERRRLLIQLDCLICDFCSSSRCFACGFLRFHLATDTLAVRLTIHHVGLAGDFHSEVRAPPSIRAADAALQPAFSSYDYLKNGMD
jgi:hypothetical protein